MPETASFTTAKLLLVSLLWPCVAHADASEPEVTRLLDRAQQEHDSGRFEVSLRTLGQAAGIARSPALLARIKLRQGLGYHVINRAGPAEQAFIEALRLDPTLALDPNKHKPAIVALFTGVRQRVRGQLAISCDPADATAEVALGTQRLGTTPLSRQLPVGRHLVVARVGERRALREVVVAWQRTTRLVLPCAKPPPTKPASTTAPTRAVKPPTRERFDRGPSPRRGRRVWTWVAAGGALVAAGAGVALTLSAVSDYDEWKTTDDRQRYYLLKDRIEDKRIGFGVLYGAAGALAVTAGVLYWLEGREGAPERAASLRPLVGPGVVGGQVLTRF